MRRPPRGDPAERETASLSRRRHPDGVRVGRPSRAGGGNALAAASRHVSSSRTASREGPTGHPAGSDVMRLARAAPVPPPEVNPTARPSTPPVASVEAAEAAALRYVSDQTPGLSRVGKGPRFRYRAADGSPVRDLATRRRIRALAIPAAWTQVWICSSPAGHIQAIGRDARGRKQYRYHPRWRQVRDATKYARLRLFARRLPQVRRQVRRDLARPGCPARRCSPRWSGSSRPR
jgi:hypothetical protein